MNATLDTVRMILDIFAEHRIKADQSLSIRELHRRRYGWERHHRENFEKAVVLMLDSKLIEWGDEDSLILTESGHEALSDRSNSKP